MTTAGYSARVALDGGIGSLREAYGGGLRPTDVVDEVLERIGSSGDGAIWIDVEPEDVLRRAAEDLVRRGEPSLSLWGMPFAVKDNIDVAGRRTTAALPSLQRWPVRSAPVVDRLLAAGALYVGKTNLDQLATGLVGTRSPYGTPRNPLDERLIPGGSSSGSAVAVARRQVAFALGTDTAGSGRVPAAMCGIVGIKGAPGTSPMGGVVPASPSVDCISTFAGCVRDGLEVEAVLAGEPWQPAEGSLRVATSAVDHAVLEALEEAGHQLSSVDLTRFHEAGDLLYGGAWLADRTAALTPMLSRGGPGVDVHVRAVVAGGAAYTGVDVFLAQHRLREIEAELASWWAEIDVLVVPTVPFVPTRSAVAADPIGVNVRLGRNTAFANLLGLAAIAVPPMRGPGGVTLLSPPDRVGALAAAAQVIERMGRHREVQPTSDNAG